MVENQCPYWSSSSKWLVDCQQHYTDRNIFRYSWFKYLGIYADLQFASPVCFSSSKFECQDFGRLGCVSFPFLQSAAILSNALILCLIAYDRYVCVVKMQPHTMKAKPGWPIVGCIIAVWIVSIGKNRWQTISLTLPDCIWLLLHYENISKGIALPSFWIWRVYYFILVDDIPDPEIGMDFCSVFPSCNNNTKLGPKIYPAYHVVSICF